MSQDTREKQLQLMEYMIEGLFSDMERPVLETGIPVEVVFEIFGGATGLDGEEVTKLLFALEKTEVIYILHGTIFAGDPTKPRGLSWSVMKELCALAANPDEEAKEEFRRFWKRISERATTPEEMAIKQVNVNESLKLKQPKRIERMVIGDIINNIQVAASNSNSLRSKYTWFT